jgi:hypothetical protein
MSGTLTVDYFLIRQWRELLYSNGEPVREGLYQFYVKDNFKIRTRRNYFPLEIELFKDNVLVVASAMPTIGVWTKKTKNIPGLAKTMKNCPSTTSNILP